MRDKEESGEGTEWLTCSQATFVDPGVHICALIFELLDVKVPFFDLGLKAIDFIDVGPDCFIEGPCQGVGGGGHGGRRGVVSGGIVGAFWRSLDGQGGVIVWIRLTSGGGTLR